MKPFSIAGIQLSVSSDGDNLGNMEKLAAYVKRRYPWVDMLLFPELCVFGVDKGKAIDMPGEVEGRLCALAAAHSVWLVPGSLYEKNGGKIFNTSPVINPVGKVVARFRKMFPFLPFEVSVAAGTEFVVFDVAGAGRIGISICYDMWFPETTRHLAAMGAEVILHPTLTDTIDRDIELSIVKASAATNQCYFFDINSVGDGGCGRSIVVDPAGYVLHEADSSAQIIPIEIDFAKVRRERERGIRGLGQPLKSFRDRAVSFSVYEKSEAANAYLNSLGPLVKPASALGRGNDERTDSNERR